MFLRKPLQTPNLNWILTPLSAGRFFIFIQLSTTTDDKLTALAQNANHVGFLILLPGGVLNMSFKQRLLPPQRLNKV